ncbi:glycosyltransferase family 2 protein [Chitinivibrio alkaliphilus]|uniref:Glycosyl transferase family 2 n=1 Tax=Chitinivibrio alkaliphilus ACht1 TaxID=1313304 RepID=U7DBJ1_9BACT|nr:glycosyltransferase family 2 protein [Chitinivibrio alkaliphilus]ERP38933.1 glycosyl transferase family 2 [Chitinivibrio alkaliphilus ACht1]
MISVLIVHYKTEALSRATLNAVYASNPCPPLEVILVDNNSQDGSAQGLSREFPQLRVLYMEENLGFARANNVALAEATGDVLLLLNSDVVLEKDALSRAYELLMSHKDIGCVGARLTLPDGSLDHACHRGRVTPLSALYYFTGLAKRFPNSRRFGQYTLSWMPLESPHDIDALSGAFCCIRREVYARIGPLDAQYFMYGEDLDWCARIRQAGWRIYYDSRIKGIHYKGGSSGKRPWWLVYEFYRAMWIYYDTHHAPAASLLEKICAKGGIALLCGIALLRNCIKRRIR